MNLLFINALKGLRKKKVQMIGIILCIMLATGIFTAMSMGLDRIEGRYYSYLRQQNVEDFAFIPKIDYSKDYTVEEKDGYTLITLDYKGSKGYMKWEDGKMCAYDNCKCSFYFERGEGSLNIGLGK